LIHPREKGRGTEKKRKSEREKKEGRHDLSKQISNVPQKTVDKKSSVNRDEISDINY